MDIHKNARLTVHGRERIVRQVMSGQTPQAVALAAGVCPRTIRKWLSRYRAEGLAGLQDRAARGRIGCVARRRSRLSKRSSSCGANAGRAGRLRPRSASRRPPSAAFCVA